MPEGSGNYVARTGLDGGTVANGQNPCFAEEVQLGDFYVDDFARRGVNGSEPREGSEQRDFNVRVLAVGRCGGDELRLARRSRQLGDGARPA